MTVARLYEEDTIDDECCDEAMRFVAEMRKRMGTLEDKMNEYERVADCLFFSGYPQYIDSHSPE